MSHYESESGSDLFPVAQVEQRASVDRLCEAFCHTSALGFAILDDQLRFANINQTLVAMNGISMCDYIGNSVRDILGDEFAGKVEPHLMRLLATGESSLHEVRFSAPSTGETGSFMEYYFPIADRTGRVVRIGAVVMDVTQHRKLDALVTSLASTTRREGNDEEWWMAREIHQSLDDYHHALGMAMHNVIRMQKRTPDVLEEAIRNFDDRIRNMQDLVNAVARKFAIV